MNSTFLFSFILFTLFANNVHCNKHNEGVKKGANILGIFHFPSKSHHILGSTLLKELAKRGHNVTMLSAFPFQEKIPNYTDIELKGLIETKEEQIKEKIEEESSFLKFLIQMFQNPFKVISNIGNVLLSQDSVQNLLRSDTKFDLIITSYPGSEIFFPLSHHFNAPIILFNAIGTSSFLNTITGNINPYSYVPSSLDTLTDNMTFFQRVQNTLSGIFFEILSNLLLRPQYKELNQKYFPNAPPLEQLYNNVALALVNTHFSTESPRPYTPNMIQIGGFHVESLEPLPKDLQTYLDEAKEGVIYFSFGGNISPSQLSEDKLKIIVKCLSKIKQKILWKYDENLVGLPKNIRIEEWFPQTGVLAHPNVKAFITHGGKGSIVEATKNGIPMIILPFFADQFQNAANAVKDKYALSMTFDEVTEKIFSNALNEILTNPIYKENVKLKSSLLNAQPMNPMDKAVYWIEHVIQHKGADHLKPASLKLNIFQQLCLDVIAFLLGVLLTSLFIMYLLIKGTCKLCFRRKSKEKLKVS